MDSISLEIETSVPFPKYQTSEVPRKSTTKESQTLKNGFSASTITVSIPEPASDKPLTSRRFAGNQID
jgi:hypothetical protein